MNRIRLVIFLFLFSLSCSTRSTDSQDAGYLDTLTDSDTNVQKKDISDGCNGPLDKNSCEENRPNCSFFDNGNLMNVDEQGTKIVGTNGMMVKGTCLEGQAHGECVDFPQEEGRSSDSSSLFYRETTEGELEYFRISPSISELPGTNWLPCWAADIRPKGCDICDSVP